MTEQPPTPPTGGPNPDPATSSAQAATTSQAAWVAPAATGQPVPGAAGFVYADVPNRAIAYIIDAVILFVINFVIGLVLLPIFSPNPNTIGVGAIVGALISTAITGVYFVYTWTAMRGSPGQKVLGMQVGNSPDGATITMDQAIKRWIFLGAPFGIASAFAGVGTFGLLIGLLGLAYFIFLLVTTAQSPTKQGFHDLQANTVVVKAARTVT